VHTRLGSFLPPCIGYFPYRVSWTVCLGWLQTLIFLISLPQPINVFLKG
jgi:hypothetical protein